MQEIIVNKNEAGRRLDKCLCKYLKNAPTSFIYKMLRKKNIVLNDRKAQGNEVLELNDSVKLYLSEETLVNMGFALLDLQEVNTKADITERYKESDSKAGFIDKNAYEYLKNRIKIVYEDSDVLILCKDFNILSQKANNNDYSVNEWAIDYLLENKSLSKEELRTFKPSVCNRLDRNTSGLITVGKSLKGLQALSSGIANKRIRKFYTCIVSGQVPEKFSLKGFLYKDEKNNKVEILKNKDDIKPGFQGEISTDFLCKKRVNGYSLLEVEIHTGKTHQIRASLSYLGYPIVGDVKYGDKTVNKKMLEKGIKNQLLHSEKLVFPKDFEIEGLKGKEIVSEADFKGFSFT
ncbi:MAG: RluA family pseudouridine synthase [Lachnospiraceae bacterium]|nr:RluA family pseudouridine synthase [Lachnospiraceae bacterium]